MKKTEIRVTIDSVEKQQRAIEILERYGEPIWGSGIELEKKYNSLMFSGWGEWYTNKPFLDRTEITLDELEELLKAEK